MKRVFYVIIFLIILTTISAQNVDRLLLTSKSKKDIVYVKLTGNCGTVFQLKRWIDKGGAGYTIANSETIIKQLDSSEFLFVGKSCKIQRCDHKLLFNYNNGKNRLPKKIKIDTVTVLSSPNSLINNGIWWTSFFQLCSEIDSSFKLYKYSFRNGFYYWESFKNKEIDPYDFKSFTQNKITTIRDSIITVQSPLVLLTNEIISNLSSLDYPTLRDKMLKLPFQYKSQSWYFGYVVNEICKSRPELFFKLVEDLPDRKGRIFDMVEDDKEILRKLKNVDTNSSTKKEFFKQRRKDRTSAITSATIYIAGNIALWGGVIYLIVK